MATNARKAPAQRTPADTPSSTPAEPVLVLEFEATKETAGTVRYDMTQESADANGGRGTNIYIPKTAINSVPGGLGHKIRVEVHKI